MNIIEIAQVKEYEGIKTPSEDAELSYLVPAVNSIISKFLGYDELDYEVEKDSIYPVKIFMDTDAPAGDIAVIDASTGDTLPGLTGTRGSYTFDNADFVGTLKLTVPTPTPPADVVLAALHMVKHFRKEEYKQSQAGAGQSVTNTPTSSNIPKHVLALLAPYRPI